MLYQLSYTPPDNEQSRRKANPAGARLVAGGRSFSKRADAGQG
jgi:hypothetical protein